MKSRKEGTTYRNRGKLIDAAPRLLMLRMLRSIYLIYPQTRSAVLLLITPGAGSPIPEAARAGSAKFEK